MSVVISARGFSASVLSVCDGRRSGPASVIRLSVPRFLKCFLGRAPLSGLRGIVTPQRLKGCNSLPPLLCITNGGLEPVCHKGSQGCCDIWQSRGRRFGSPQFTLGENQAADSGRHHRNRIARLAG